MANLNLRFYNKQGEPLNFQYVGPTASSTLDTRFNYVANSTNASPSAGNISLLNLSSGFLYLNILDQSGFNITSWVNSVSQALLSGSKITLTLSFAPAQTISCVISNA